ncbi:hypothetical protein DL95DRAFT_424379 [Leptodontidium sp. 2 PMI_412]|nr:hypothetical protein DL95DRAFT_424379 [Leptodontidium sp. 2 PMI_412]
MHSGCEPRPISSPHSITDSATGSVKNSQYSLSQVKPLSSIPLGSVVGLATKAELEGGIAIPLRQGPEVRLMKYYTDYMCPWFDLCNTRGNHFGQELPRRTIESPTLLNAIFAVSSRHLNCFEHLRNIPIDDPALRKDDLLAAMILLRTLEELDVPLVGEDYQGHLLGIQIFMNAQDPSIPASGLRQVSFWIGLRQDIYRAFVNQRPLKTELDHNLRPLSFLPLSYRVPNEAGGEVFPEIWYMNHAVVISIVDSIICRVLLMCYNPTLPRIGLAHKHALQQVEEEIRNQIRELCGTAISNRWTIPALFTACMGVTIGSALLNILVITKKDHGWPTHTAQLHFKRAWGWSEDT